MSYCCTVWGVIFCLYFVLCTEGHSCDKSKFTTLGPFIREKINRSLLWPWLTYPAYTPYTLYKIYVHGFLKLQLAQAMAYPGLGILGCTYLGRGFPWTWKCLYKCTQVLSVACSSREQFLRIHFFCYYSPDVLFAHIHLPEKNGKRLQRITQRKRFSENANVECSRRETACHYL